MVVEYLVGAGVVALGVGIYKLLEEIDKDAKEVNNSYSNIENTYNEITYYTTNNIVHEHIRIHNNNNYYNGRKQLKYNKKNKIKKLHDKLFNEWLKFKKSSNRIENNIKEVKKRIKGKKGKKTSKEYRYLVAKIIKKMNKKLIEINRKKRNSHYKWQKARTLLLS